MIDPVRDRVHPLGRKPQPLDDAATDELARHDDGRRVPRRALVPAPPEDQLGPGEELRQLEVLEVVDGHDARQLEPGQRDRKGVVDEVERFVAVPQRPGRIAATAIAKARCRIDCAGRYSETSTSGSPSPAPGAAGGTNAV